MQSIQNQADPDDANNHWTRSLSLRLMMSTSSS